MLTINSENDYLDIGEATINVSLKSPFMTDLDGSRVCPSITFPVTDKNVKFFEFIHRPQKRRDDNFSRDLSIKFSDISLFSGSVYVQNANNKKYECFFGLGKGDFWKQVENKSLRDLELGGERTYTSLDSSNPGSYASVIGTQYPTHDFAVFPVYNENIAVNIPHLSCNWQNDVRQLNPGAPYVVYTIATPFPYVAYVLEQIFSEHGYLIKENKVYDDEYGMRRICLYNPIIAKNGYVVSSYDFTIRLNEHCPDVTIKTFLQEICKQFNISIFIDKNKRVYIISNDDIVVKTATMRFSAKATKDSFIINFEQVYKKYVFKWTADDTDEFWADNIKDIVDVIKIDPVATFADLPTNPPVLDLEAGMLCLVQDEYKYYQYTYDSGTGTYSWVYYCLDHASSYEVGSGTEDETYTVESQITPVLDEWMESGYPNGFQYFAKVKVYGNYRNFKTDNSFEEFGIRLFMNHGLQYLYGVTPGHLWPVGHSDVHNLLSFPPFNLFLDNNYFSFVRVLHINFIHWLLYVMKACKFSQYITPAEFSNILLQEKYDIDGVPVIIGEIITDFSNNSIGESEISGWVG